MTKQRLALCVGLNYPNTDAALAGCVNDADDWCELLVAQGYEAKQLLEPTKASVVAELEAMVGRAKRGDRLVFTFSGHGTWLPDRSGDEADRRDEALCMADFRSGGLLTDDELLVLFGKAKFGVRRLILSDSCHSGTVSRSAGGTVGVSSAPSCDDCLPRFLPPATFLPPDQLEAAYAVEDNRARSTPRAGAVLISGCDDPEYSYDARFNGRGNGAFTRRAIDAWKPGISNAAWHKAIRTRLPSSEYPQTPQLSASRYQRYLPAL